jgi:hypothetical protein
VILANGIAASVVQQQTQTIPIVLAFVGDVFATGLVKNLAVVYDIEHLLQRRLAGNFDRRLHLSH